MDVRKATTQKDFFMCVKVRGRVFVDEQHVLSAIEVDDEDQTCLHYLITKDDEVIGALRAIQHDDYTKLGRICILKEYRGLGYGKQLVDYVMNDIKGEFRLGAQITALGFYEDLGFEAYGDHFMEANMEHVMMKKII